MAKKEASKRPKAAAAAPRTRKPTRKQAKLKAKKEVRTRPSLPGSFRLTAQVFSIFKNHWKKLGGIVLVYLLLNIIFASGVSNLGSAVSAIKSDLNSNGSNAHPIIAGLSGFAKLVASSGASTSSTGSTLQFSLIVVESLVIIWALRQLLAGQAIKIKEAYYHSMTPLIPFLLVIFFIALQLMPITFGLIFLTAVATSLGTISALWTILFGLVFLLLAAWSIHMICGSVFGLYIVTLPDMEPRAALRSAKNLVKFRRLAILRRLLFLPLILLGLMALVMIPLILYATFLVLPIFYALSMLSILFTHTYLYSLYRGLLE